MTTSSNFYLFYNWS